jgi:capsular exopolysaccharide synthesis family protein
MSTPLSQFQLEDTARLREYFAVLRVRKWSVIAITLVATLAAAYFAKSQADVYTSTARIQITNPIAAFLPITSASVANTGTEEEVATSSTVSECAHFIYLRPDTDPTQLCTPARYENASVPDWWLEEVSTDVPSLTSVLEINFTDEKPEVAQGAAQSYAQAYVFYKTQQAVTYVDNLRKPLLELQTSLNEKATRLQKAVNEDIDATNAAAAANNQAQLASANAKLQSDQAQLSSVNAQLAVTQQQLVTADPTKITPPTIISDAPLEDSPSNTLFKILLVVVGLLLGLTLGIGQAFVRHRLDDRIRGRNDLEARLGVPVIATIPHLGEWLRRQTTHLVTLEKRWSPAAEAYRALRTMVMFNAATEGRKVTMVTSCGEGEGKTTTSANLAVVLAEAGKRVILVSADLRKPRIATFFGLVEKERGITDVLSGEVDVDHAVQDTMVPGLQLIPSGPIPGRPTEMLLSPAFEALMSELRARADFIVMDITPLLVVADAKEVARLTDQIIFVADAKSTSRAALTRARKELAQMDTPVVGAVLNNFKASRTVEYSEYSHRRYRYGYRRKRGADASTNGSAPTEAPADAELASTSSDPPRP